MALDGTCARVKGCFTAAMFNGKHFHRFREVVAVSRGENMGEFREKVVVKNGVIAPVKRHVIVQGKKECYIYMGRRLVGCYITSE